MSGVVQAEVGAQVRELLSSVPPQDADSKTRADWYVRKAEVLDFVAATHPQWAAQAERQGLRAESKARAIACDY